MNRKIFFRLFLIAAFFMQTDFSYSTLETVHTCYYNKHPLILGPKGGCYYINSSGNKTYVDRSYCNC